MHQSAQRFYLPTPAQAPTIVSSVSWLCILLWVFDARVFTMTKTGFGGLQNISQGEYNGSRILTGYSQSRLVGGRSARSAKRDRTRPLTCCDIKHIPVILFWLELHALFCGDKSLEQSDGCTVDIASNESHPDALFPGHVL